MSGQGSAELFALALTLAYDHACALIEGECRSVLTEEVGEPGWYELPEKADADVDDAVRYLEMRGLLTRHEQHPTWVSIADESEADQ